MVDKLEAMGTDMLNLKSANSNEMKGDNMMGLMSVNRVHYSYPADLSLSESRTTKIFYSDINSYTSASNEIVFKFTSSSDFAVPENCYMRFELNVLNSTGAVTDLYALPIDTGACALFFRVLLEDASGQEIERIDNLNTYMRNYLALQSTSAYLPYLGSAAGIAVTGATAKANAVNVGIYDACNTAGAAISEAGDVPSLSCAIPLHWILGLFQQKRLIPPQLLSGARLRLSLENPNRCLVTLGGLAPAAAADRTPSYRISNPRIMVDSCKLSPFVERKLMEMAGLGKLDMYYKTAFYSGTQFTSSDLTFNLNKSVSRAVDVMFLQQSTTNQSPSNFAVAADIRWTHYGTLPNIQIKEQWRLGSEYYPQQPVTSNCVGGGGDVTTFTPSGGVDQYMQYVHIGGDHDCHPILKDASLIDYPLFANKIQVLATDKLSDNKYCARIQTLERSSALELSGLPVNNSRALSYTCSNSGAVTGGVNFHSWIRYVKLLKIFADKISIKE